ncbi:MAG: TSUP family transporter, partial [Paraclostridium sp.]
MISVLLGLLAVITAGFTTVYASDFMKNRENKKSEIFGTGIMIGFITDFLDAIGVGSFATTTAIFKLNKKINISDKFLPGTLNVAHALPMITQAFLSLTVISVDITTLVALIIAAVAGSWIGAGVISKLPEKKVRTTMGIALIVTAMLITAKQLGLMPAGGEALGLTGV